MKIIAQILLGIVIGVSTIYGIASTVYFFTGINEAGLNNAWYGSGCYSKYEPRYMSLYPTYDLGCWLGTPVRIDNEHGICYLKDDLNGQ